MLGPVYKALKLQSGWLEPQLAAMELLSFACVNVGFPLKEETHYGGSFIRTDVDEAIDSRRVIGVRG